MNKIALGVAGATLATAAVMGAAGPAHAEDKRPCVSTTEYHDTLDVVKWSTMIDRPGPSPTRRVLEKRWDVVDLGIIDHGLSDKTSVVIDYRICGYTIEDASVSVVYHGRAGRAELMMKFVRPGALTTVGSIY